MTDKEKKINHLTSTILHSDFAYDENLDVDEYLGVMSSIMCQFDTDIAIEVFKKLEPRFGEKAKWHETAIKVNYGY